MFAESLEHIAVLWCVKAAFLLLYWDLMSRVYQNALLQLVMWGSAAYLLASYIAITFVFLFYCRPISNNWLIYPRTHAQPSLNGAC